MVTSPRAGQRNCPPKLSLSKYTDITIHWNALEEQFLIVLSTIFCGKMNFLNFSQIYFF
jgi:hypothetical protein